MNPAAVEKQDNPYAVVTGNLNLVRCLGHAGVPVFCATSIANRIAFSSRFVGKVHETPSPTQSPGPFIDELIEIGKNELDGQGVLFYDGDGDLLAISENRDELGKYYWFLMPPHDLVETLLDKRRFSTLAADLQLNVPKTIFSQNDQRDFSNLSESHFPILVKPQTRVGWLDNSASWKFAQGGKAFRVGNLSDLERLMENVRGFEGGMILQQLIPGPESQVYSYHAFIDEAGTVLAEYCGRKHMTYPLEYGRSAFIEVYDDKDLIRLGRDYVARVGVVGVVKLDFKLDARTNDYFLLEINPRFSIWNWPGAIAGRNLPAVAYRKLIGDEAGVSDAPVRSVFWADGRAHRRASVQSGRPGLNVLAYFSRETVYNIWSLSDPLPWIMDTWHKMTDFCRRAVRRLSRVR